MWKTAFAESGAGACGFTNTKTPAVVFTGMVQALVRYRHDNCRMKKSDTSSVASASASFSPAQISPAQVHAFRLERHHLLDRPSKDRPSKDLVTICRDVCGVQAQIMSAAYLQLWARNHAVTRKHVEEALWQARTLIKTSLMRQTVHLVPSDEFWLYIAALRSCRIAGALRVMARCGIAREEADSLTSLIMDAFSHGPLGRAEIFAAVRPKVSKRVRAWMEKVWSIVRIPIAEGLLCYGSGEGNEVKFIRTDQWLGKPGTKLIPEAEAQSLLLCKYLRAYGPATLNDFAHWAGIPITQVRPLRALPGDQLLEVDAEKDHCLLLRKDLKLLKSKPANTASVRLLPHFDPYLLAHREKDHLLEKKNYKRVYRNQGWISPVVLIDGEIAGVWSYQPSGRQIEIAVELFKPISKNTRAQIEDQAMALGEFFERTPSISFTS
jgi:hypothetical protein